MTSCLGATSSTPSSLPLTTPTISTHGSTVLTQDAQTTEAAVAEIATVISVTDGDTFRIRFPQGSEDRVRLIGIDAPEDGSAFAAAATTHLENLVLGEEVRLVVDVSDRDQFGRLLRYAYVGDLFVNEAMVRAGLAVAKRYPPDTAMAEILEAAQVIAEQGLVGLFAVPIAATTILNGANLAYCDPSYPDLCIQPPHRTSTVETSRDGTSSCCRLIRMASTATKMEWVARHDDRPLYL